MNNNNSNIYLLALIIVIVLINYMTPISAKNQTLQTEKIPNYSYREYDHLINQIYLSLLPAKNHNLNEKITIISNQFLGSPYVLYPLGEGEQGKYDQQQLYRTDSFDCLTFVETVLAIAYGNELKSFKENIIRIRYHEGIVSFVNRNHFTCVDWNKNNSEKGYIEDITSHITNQQGTPIAKVTKAVINKPKWYLKFTPRRLKQLDSLSVEQSEQLLNDLHQLGQQMEKEESTVTYLPLTELFNNTQIPNQFAFDQIPSGAIIEIVRPNWNMMSKIGTHLQISHLGFALRINQVLIFRHASMLEGKVIDILLSDYLKHYLGNPTVKGISVWVPRDTYSSIRNTGDDLG